MKIPSTLAVFLLPLAACAVTTAPPQAVEQTRARPLDTLQPGADLATIRSDLLATARERFGDAAVQQALAAPAYMFVKRFYGMAPPPPPGAGPDWRAPTPSALLMRNGDGQWQFATPGGWRPARAEAAADIESRIADARLWSEPAYTPPCPDFGANLLLLKVPGRAETTRHAQCSGAAADLAQAALNA